MVRGALNRSASVGEIGGKHESGDQLASAGNFERQVDEVFNFLCVGRFDDGNIQMLRKKPAVGGNLRRIAPGIVSVDNDGSALFVGTGKIRQRQRIGSYMQTHTFHGNDRTNRKPLRAVKHSGREGFVIVYNRPNPLFCKEFLQHGQRVEITCNRATGVSSQKMHPALGFQSALYH